MMDNKAKAQKLKAEGNSYFAKGDYARAEGIYSEALIQDPQFSSLYTNRAMCRFNLRAYDGVIADCDACLAIDPNSVKAHYFKSKALLEMGADLDAACEWALSAYQACQSLDSKSLQMTMTHLLRCRSERWKRRERARRREAQDLEREVLEMLERARDREVDDAQSELERTVAREEGDQKLSRMRDIFESARKEDDRKRDVPEWLIDDISFNVMVDPVMTPHNGRSYERASIQAAINNNAIDPYTREPLSKGELVPNLRLRQACEWFLQNNGWAYDW